VELGKFYFSAIAAAFRNQYPDGTFYLKLGDPGTLLTMLKKAQIDFALVDVFQTLNQLLDKCPTVTEKFFLKFLLKEIESLGLQIGDKSSG